ncbi:MAG: type IX secretion system membrane protein PorP/SprF, partial [Bacteroidia bacterium]|nr:type IX secretion system membrane protein PorP/SprF [Bacteroidia bacterium]
DDAVSGLIGLQISPQLLISYSYDFTTTELRDFNNGSHDILLRFELISREKQLKSPRFF